jgi:hypothetical protein
VNSLPCQACTNARCIASYARWLLRALASVGVFSEQAVGMFENTPLSDALRATAPASMRSMALFIGEHPSWDAWGELLFTIRTGKSAFEKVNGALPFEYFAQHPEAARYFNEAMTGFSGQEIDAIHRAFDFSGVQTLVDVGGGHGAMLCSTLRRNPGQNGILFDRLQVVGGAGPVIASFDVGGRCKVVEGDFFESVPDGADGYILKHILHDWNDEQACAILRTIRRAISEKGRLFVIDPVIRPGNEPTFAKLLDIEMMVIYNDGRERTEAELAALCGASGFKIMRVVDTEAPSSVTELAPI